MQKGKFYRPYIKDPITGKSIYLHKGPNDLGKGDIPREERCEGFDEMWNMIYKQVMEYYEEAPSVDIHEFDDWPSAKEDEEIE